MINRLARQVAHLLLYGGLFIGLCAACITALSFELTGRVDENLTYILLVGTATSALYNIHRIVGLAKTEHLVLTGRFAVVRHYHRHIRIYTVFWILLSLWLAIPLCSMDFVLALLPAGLVAFAYVMPFLPGKKRLRDLGWGKILMISWSWAWLTAVMPLWYFTDAPLQMIIIHGLERLIWIILLTIPFEIRDITLDQSMGLTTLPVKLGPRRTFRLALLFSFLIILLSLTAAFHYFNLPYGLSMILITLAILPLIRISYRITDDLFFAGFIDGLMILVLILFSMIHYYL